MGTPISMVPRHGFSALESLKASRPECFPLPCMRGQLLYWFTSALAGFNPGFAPAHLMRKLVKGGIRLRLLSSAAGVALPLAFVGLAGVWAMSQATRHQLEESIKKQAEITAVAFEQWMEAQREPLATVAAYVDEQPAVGLDFHTIFG